ncbi:MAG: glycoside hydrolase family 2 protein [Anaerolineae bacterium]|nr:glycoside hydrolase family 2 protein [Anaerolineae bacterium]
MTSNIRPVTAKFREAGAEEWLPAQIPGGVHTDLLALGRIPDPFVADNELRVQWVAERDWEYEVLFQIDAEMLAYEHIFLVCDGLDTLSDVTFNGAALGQTGNMFRQYRWDVTPLLVEGENTLHVCFRSTVVYAREKQAELPLMEVGQALPGGAYVRKAPCQFGWDWGPQLPPIGFWKEVRLEGYAGARLDNVHLRQKHEDGEVTISAGVNIERWQTVDFMAVLKLTSPDGYVQEAVQVFKDGADTGYLELPVSDPQLWWPNGYPSPAPRTGGSQPLYTVEVLLYEADTLRDRREYKIGLRTIELRREPDEFGVSFTFVVNGVPIFAKGANWIPADSFPTRIEDAHLEYLIRSAAEAHMNMLRVWGGGFYEEERFYDLCDRYGILIWQDFTFACSIYPDDTAFFDNVRAEAVQNIRRLRHRASLALWCGNNEMEAGWVYWGWMNRQTQALRFKAAYDRMYHHMLPDLCAAEDPDHAYWPSSPSSDIPFEDPGGTWAGDTHNWEVWHGGRPFSHYRSHPSRFVSEFGFQSLPSLETVRTYADPADWNMTSYIMEHHQRNDSGNGKIINYMTDHFRMPRDFPSLVYLTQILQAEAVRSGVEYWRRNKVCTSGTLYWQLNDCWPVASWASLDYFGRWKALHYAARRFYAPLLLSAEVNRQQVTLYVTSDLLDIFVGTVRWSLETLSGEVVKSGREALTVPALNAVKICTLDFASEVTAETQRDLVLVYELWRDSGCLSSGVATFVQTKHLNLNDPELIVAISESDAGFVVEITAQSLARFVWLELESGGAGDADLVLSDNYFDLPAGRTAKITIPASGNWELETLSAALHVRSIVDSY